MSQIIYKHIKNINKNPRYNIKTLTDNILSGEGNSSQTVSKCGALPFAYLKASFTVEAAFVMPIIVIVMAMFLYCFQVFRVEFAVQNALDQAVRAEAVEQTVAQSAGNDRLTGIANFALGIGASAKAKQIMTSNGMSFSFVNGDISGVYITSSKMEDDYIKLVARYKIKMPFSVIGKKTFNIRQQAVARKWTGRSIDYENAENSEWVYVTKNGTVYHRSRECSYLNPSIKRASVTNIDSYRNSSHGKYYPCELCGRGARGSVYITTFGTRYHTDRNCSGLKRTIYHVRLDSLGGMPPCSKCG